MKTHPQVDAYLAQSGPWREEMHKLRELIARHPLTEDLKWGKPCYSFQDGNVLILQPFKDYLALMFCKGALLKDPKKLLQSPGENTQAARQLRFTSVEEITSRQSTIKAYIAEAIAVQKSGQEVAYKETSDYPVPGELTKKLQASPTFRAAFEALTPGRQRGYLLHFAAPKQSATRDARIDKCRPFILKGLGIHEHWKDKAALPARSDEGKAAKSKKFKSVDEYLDAKLDGGGKSSTGVRLLSGGNPQIARADGDAPVQAYIVAMPGWKKEVGRRIDALVTRHVPQVTKAVRWNSPFYGIEGQGFFLSFHVLTKYVKFTFFKGMSLDPIPPGGTERSGESRWIDIYEDDKLDEKQMTAWIKQAAALPGWKP